MYRCGMNHIHPLDRATKTRLVSPGVRVGCLDRAYWNMVGPFGGVTAATLLRAVLDDPRRADHPIAISVQFCASFIEGEFEVEVQPVQSNGSTQHWSIALKQHGDAIAIATAVVGTRPQTWSALRVQMPAFKDPTPPRHHFDGLSWLNHYDLRFHENPGEPVSAACHPTRTVATIADVPARALDFVSLCALSDIFFVQIAHARRRRLPCGTESISTYFHVTHDELSSLERNEVIAVADTNILHRGYSDQRAELWSPSGQLLVTSSQMAYFRDPQERSGSPFHIR